MLGFGPSPFVVLLASVLKPVDDTRMRGKFAETLLERPHVRVHIAGRAAVSDPESDPESDEGSVHPCQQHRLYQHGLFRGSRLSLDRLVAQWRYWQLLRRLRPDLVVVHAPELLLLTLLWHWLGRRRKFLYDIRENYALNVSTQQVYGGGVRRVLATGLRWVEGLAAGQASGLLLAEASYADELPFLHRLPASRVVVLENKYQPACAEDQNSAPRQLPPPGQPLQLLYSGTISVLNGVWEAVAVAQQLHTAWPGGIRLTVVGFCQQPQLLQQLQATAAKHAAWLRLVGGTEPVPHARIVAEVAQSHLGLLPYRPHPSTERCRPTKLFEYLAHGLPMLVTPNPLWLEPVAKYGAGIALDFSTPVDTPALIDHLLGCRFYPSGIPNEALWAGEGKKLWLLLDSIV